MATPSVNTTLAGADARPGSAQVIYQNFTYTSLSSATIVQYFTAPAAGKIIAAKINGSVTSDGTKTYTLVITNVTKSKTVTASSQVWDDSPVLTAGTAVSATLSTTAADVAVSAGDMITVSMAGGSGAGLASVMLVMEVNG